MTRSFVRLNELISFTVMLLMVVALVAGQSDAAGEDTGSIRKIAAIAEPMTIIEDGLKIEFDGEIGASALRISIDLASDLGHFRGEDE